MTSALLPANSTRWERALADAMPVSGAVGSAINAMRRVKYVSPRPTMLPFLVWEYGLGELTPYVDNLYELIEQGVAWQRVRGTVSAIAIGLAWIGYAAELEEAWTGRRFWNSFQLRFPALPPKDVPDLERIEAITGLSVPKRSVLRRGVHHYDVGPLEADHSALDGAQLDTESGIPVTPAGTVWSFGRTRVFEHLLDEAEGTALGNWIEPAGEGALWIDMHVPWIEANFLWVDSPEVQRAALLAAWFTARPLHVRFSADGTVIGYRRCRAVRAVNAAFGGAYKIGEESYHPHPAGQALYAEALTQFGDADGVTCTGLALVAGGERAAGIPPGRMWLAPGELSGGVAFALRAVSIPLRATVREQVKYLVRF